MSDTTNICDLPGVNNTQTNNMAQSNIKMNVSYDPNSQNSQTINSQMQQQNMPELQNNQINQPNMTYSDVVKTFDSNKPETVPMNNGNTMTNILQNMEQIAKTGAFDLPSRDIPRHENNIDEQSRVNYIPQAKNYIDEYESHEMIKKHHTQKQNQEESMEIIFQKMQIPLLLALMYFFFHLPVINKWFLINCTFCFHKDGNMNFNGYVLKSIVFAGLYFAVSMLLDTLNN
tara:strand:+ start:105 stop:794 length:690 start_codon:yes stop_codon:yes gene_type:complete